MWPEDDEIDAALRGDYVRTEVNRPRIIAGIVTLVLTVAVLGFILASDAGGCVEQPVCSMPFEALK